MSKDLENLAVMLALGATAFILWRAYRNGATLAAAVPASAPVVKTASNVQQPNASAILNSLFPLTSTASGSPIDMASPVRDLYLA